MLSRINHTAINSYTSSRLPLIARIAPSLPCSWLSSDRCSCRWSLLLLLSHVLISLLTVAVIVPHLDNHRMQHPGLTSVYNRASLTPVDVTRAADVCATSSPYPVPISPQLRRFCNGARPSTFRYQPPRRYNREDIAFTILTVDHYKYDRDEGCLHGWLSRHRAPLAYFGVTVERPAELLQPTLLIPDTGDGYISNLNKTLLALVQLYHLHPHLAWYMQTSDDAYIDVDALLLKLDAFDSDDVLYLGGSTVDGAHCWLTDSSIDYFEGGSGFVLSAGLMKKFAGEAGEWITQQWLSEEGRRHEETMFGDLMVGCFMKERGVGLTKLLGGHNQTPAGVTDWDEDFPAEDHRWWGWHYVQPEDHTAIDLFFRLQRIDQLERHGQWNALLQLSRDIAIEAHEQLSRSWALLQNAIAHPELLSPPGGVELNPSF